MKEKKNFIIHSKTTFTYRKLIIFIQGLKGERGVAGLDGLNGSPGEKGETGSTGAKGEPGDTVRIIYTF